MSLDVARVAPEKQIHHLPANVFFVVHERWTMNIEFPSEPALIADLKATYPGLHVRPVHEFGVQGYNHGVWTGGPGDMPDGLPIFSSLRYHGDSDDPADGSYEGGVHDGFTEWLESRGWYIENYDGETQLIIPILQARMIGKEYQTDINTISNRG